MTDKDAETMASDSVPRVAPRGSDVEETTRAVSRDELMRHQDAHVVVGEDAMGDEATLAVPPGQIDLGADGGIAAALVESLRGSQPNLPGGPAAPPAFPPPPQHFQNNAMPAPHAQAAAPGMAPPPSWGGEALQGFQLAQQQQQLQHQQQHHNGPPSYDPMFQQGPQSAPYPSLPHPPPSAPGGPLPGGQPNPMMNPGGYPPSQQHPQQPLQRPMQQAIPTQQAAPWVTQQSPPPAGMTAPSRFTPQVIMLVAVGAVCLAIFIIGIVLFVTTKF